MCDHSIAQYFSVVMFIMLYKMVLTFEFGAEILKFNGDKSMENISSL